MEGKSVNFLQKQIEQLKREKELLLGIVARECGCEYCVNGEDKVPCMEDSYDGDIE